MRKVFRMQYEPCNGACYTGGDDITNKPAFDEIHKLKNDLPAFKVFMDKLTKIHEPLCGNPNMRYGVDLDETSGLYVGSFWHYGKLELVSGTTLLGTLNTLIGMVLTHITSDVGIKEIADNPGLGHSVCEHGEDEDLRKWVIKHANIPIPYGIDAFLGELREVC